MSNHFHILVRVPRRPEPADLPGDEQLVALVELIDGTYDSTQLAGELKLLRERGNHQAAEELREIHFRRMWDVSEFMKPVKQRFTQWFNRRVGRKGTLWDDDRFKSVLVGGLGTAVANIAAYIDLNPVRAGLVNDPANYRCCGYAQAVAGHSIARQGLAIALEGRIQQGIVFSDSEVLAKYRLFLFDKGLERLPGEDGSKGRLGFTQAQVDAVIDRGGKIPLAQAGLCRVRYFTDGLIFGTRSFVEELISQNPCLGGKFGKGARPLKHVEAPEFFVAKDLRNKIILGSSP